MFQLSTTRLVVRDFVEDDWPAIYRMSQAPDVIRYQSWLRLTSQAHAHDWVQQAIYHNQLQPRQAYKLAVVHATSDDVIGWLGWGRTRDRSRGDYNFGYALVPKVWNQGYMTEALHTGLDYMFEALSARYITGECAKSNRGSARVIEKVGMILVDEWEETDDTTGLTETHCRYGLQIEQWKISQQDLAQKKNKRVSCQELIVNR